MLTLSRKSLLSMTILTLLFASTFAVVEESQWKTPEDNDHMLKLSGLIVSTIAKFSESGTCRTEQERGSIPIERYAEFLHEIFIKGNEFNKFSQDNSEVPQNVADSLKQAAVEFTDFRYINPPVQATEQENEEGQDKEKKPKQKREYVEIQEFYMDLIKHFSEFLSLEQYKQKYGVVSDFFFIDKEGEEKAKSQKSDEDESSSQIENSESQQETQQKEL